MCHGMSLLRDDGGERRGAGACDVAGDAELAVSPQLPEPSGAAPRPGRRIAVRLHGKVDPTVRLVRRVAGCIVGCQGALGRVVRRTFARRVGLGQRTGARCHERVEFRPNWTKG